MHYSVVKSPSPKDTLSVTAINAEGIEGGSEKLINSLPITKELEFWRTVADSRESLPKR